MSPHGIAEILGQIADRTSLRLHLFVVDLEASGIIGVIVAGFIAWRLTSGTSRFRQRWLTLAKRRQVERM